ncbi:hypothetical protein KPL70_016656 [Citrus sinensis]|nr:hypothetical protein KPL70_016656 [Citrus sinensis]
MKRSGCGGSDYYSRFHNLNITMDKSELEAAVILLELPYLMAGSEPPSRHEFSLKWGATRKRSSLISSLQSQPSVPVAVVGPTPTPTPSTCETEKEKRSKALSPASPLLFSPSESDEKTKHHSKPKLSLKREINKLKGYYDQQKALNLKLKEAVKERMIYELQMQQPQSQLSLDNAMESTSIQGAVQFDARNQHQQSPYVAHQQPLIMDRTAHNIKSSEYQYGQKQKQNLSCLPSNGGGLFMVKGNRVGPSLPLDLNAPLEESFAMEFGNSGDTISRAALAAQARQKRIQICRSKTTNKLRTPFCR